MRSLSISTDGSKVLVGTLGSDIFELAAIEDSSNVDGGGLEPDQEGGAVDSAESTDGPDHEARGGNAALKLSGVGRVLKGGLPIASGHCLGQSPTGTGGQAQVLAMDVSAQGVSPSLAA